MKKAEIILVIISLIAIICRLYSIDGAVVMSTLSFSMLSLMYLFFGFILLNGIQLRNIFRKHAYKHLNWKQIIGSVGVGISLSITVIGVLYALNNLPGASLILRLGITLLILICAISLIIYNLKPSPFIRGILKRCIALIIAGILLIIL